MSLLQFVSNAISIVMRMQLSVFCFQVLVATSAGIWLALTREGAQVKAAALGAQFAFIVGAGAMLFSEKAWWPVTTRLIELLFWVAFGSLVALSSSILTAQTKRLIRR
jgi:hypothetical protein